MLYAVAEFSKEVVGTGQQCSSLNWFRVSGLCPDGRGNWSWSLLCVAPVLCFGLREVFCCVSWEESSFLFPFL